jgi:hypothetical protein
MNEHKVILFDADVISHFIKGNQLAILPLIFPNCICILDRVKAELIIRPKFDHIVEKFIKDFNIKQEIFPHEDLDVLFEYSSLIAYGLGDGESSILSMARFKGYEVASSNLSDVSKYCKDNKITNYCTMDILKFAHEKRILTETDINNTIRLIKEKGSKLPVNSITEYIQK